MTHEHEQGWDEGSPGYSRVAGIKVIPTGMPIRDTSESWATERPGWALGAQASTYDPRRLSLADFIEPAALPPAPTVFSNSTKVRPWQMLGNDKKGCCVVAGMGHLDMLLSILSAVPSPVNEQAILDLYFKLTGGPDVGLVIQDFLRHVRKQDFLSQDILGFAYVDPKNTELTKQALYMFNGVMRGLMLPLSAQAQVGSRWDVSGPLSDPLFRPGGWGGHLTLDTGYSPAMYETVTWGQVQLATETFYKAYSMEGWVIIPWRPVPGFNRAKFIDALKQIGAWELDADIPPDPVPPAPPQPVPAGYEPPGELWRPNEQTLNQWFVEHYGTIADVDLNIRFRKQGHWPWSSDSPVVQLPTGDQ